MMVGDDGGGGVGDDDDDGGGGGDDDGGGGGVSRQMYSGGRLGQSDFFAVELFDAMLYLVVDLGDGVRRFNFKTHATPLSDGSAHYVKVERSTSAFSLLLDNDTRPVDIGGRNTSLDLGI